MAQLGLIVGQNSLTQADFSFTKFIGRTEFDTAAFESSVSFEEAEFDKDSQVSFFTSSFKSEVSFKKAIFNGYLNFQGVKLQDVFCDGSDLSLRQTRLEAPEKLSFHSVRLRPSWFVETDCRKFVFTNIQWVSEKSSGINVKDELSSLQHSNAPTYLETLATYRLLLESKE